VDDPPVRPRSLTLHIVLIGGLRSVGLHAPRRRCDRPVSARRRARWWDTGGRCRARLRHSAGGGGMGGGTSTSRI